MIVFVDTSALFALLVQDDSMHVRASANFNYFAQQQARLLTSSYVLVETMALLQRRVGYQALADFQTKIQPLLETVWVDGDWHRRAAQRLWRINKREVSLVDCVSFEIMEARSLETAFAFDAHFEEQGFTLAAFHELEPSKSNARHGEG